jgi:MFS family permease
LPDHSAAAAEAPLQSPFGSSAFRVLWSTNLLSNFGTQAQVVAAGWLMAQMTGSAQYVALVQTATYTPIMLFILAGGALADRGNRRLNLLITQAAMFLIALTLGLLTSVGWLTPHLLLVLVFAGSMFNAFSNPNWQGSLRDLLPRSLISHGVALNSTSVNLARTLGPALGGLLVNFAGAAAFFFNALSFIGFLAALLFWARRPSVHLPIHARLLPAMADGIRYVARTEPIRRAVIRGGLSGLSASAIFALTAVLVSQHLHADSRVYGVLLACCGTGAVVSAYLGAGLRARKAPDWILRTASMALAAGLVLLGFAGDARVAGVGAALGGAGWTLSHSTLNTTVQLSAAPAYCGRALATYQTATFAGMSAGSAGLGWVAAHHGIVTAFLLAGICQLGTGLGSGWLALPKRL